MTRIHRTIETLDGMIVPGEDRIDTIDDTLTADTLVESGLEDLDEQSLLSIPADEVDELADRIEELSDRDLQVVAEIGERVHDDFGLISDREDSNKAGDFWWTCRYAARKEWFDRHGREFGAPAPTYEGEEGVPSAVGVVSTRILSDWVVEMFITDPSANPQYEVPGEVVAEATERFRIDNVDPVGFRSTLYNELAWELEGMGEHEGKRFAIAPIEKGENLTMWVWDDFAEEWSNARGVISMRTWPDKWAWELDQPKPL